MTKKNLEIIFFTSNDIKLAHLRYLAENYPVKIHGFKQKTYHASYKEPRINSREDLLKQSYRNALEQAKKAGIDVENRFFILEDTSVKIDVLSSEKMEIPGLDVKYWMENRTFASIDSDLKEKGNNRDATVRSDILLHIPDSYRRKWSTEDPYLVFSGVQQGSVCERERDITTNLVFPWLDNRTFNKWFVPKGERIPISLLPIAIADKYDFRRFSFKKMVNFLMEKGLVYNIPAQAQLNLNIPPNTNRNPMLVICGYTCAGKTTLSQHLVEKYNYIHIEASDFMYLNYLRRHGAVNAISINDFAEEALNTQPQIAARDIVEYIEDFRSLPVVISGFRNIKELELVKSTFEYREELKFIFVEVSQQIRFARFNKRKRGNRTVNIGEFAGLDEQQAAMGLRDISKEKGLLHIVNEETISDFFSMFASRACLEEVQETILKSIDPQHLAHCKEIKLGDAILIALLHKWNSTEDSKYLTTAEIAKEINLIFPKPPKKKHKDNVSRYFNQDYYPYFEIQGGDKNKYRLSNTGYGKALLTYSKLIRNIESLEQ